MNANPDRPDFDVVGMWVTADAEVRREFRPDGRYEEAHGAREDVYTGRYTVRGNHLDYVDDNGSTGTGDIRDGVLHQARLVFYREE